MDVAKVDHNYPGSKHSAGSFSPSMVFCSRPHRIYLNPYFERTDSGLAVELKKEDDIFLTEAGSEENVDTKISKRSS